MAQRAVATIPDRFVSWLTRPDSAVDPQEAARRGQRLTFTGVVGLGVLAALTMVLAVGVDCGSALFAASAAASVGGLAGFLFGIPRTRPDGDEDGKKASPSESSAGLRPNTNLERLSDSLTKMLVGVGLTQAQQIGPTINHLSELIRPSSHNNLELAGFCIETFTIWGFFASYLAFRMFFTPAFRNVDRASGMLLRAERLERSDNNAQAAVAFQEALTQMPSDASPTKRRLAAEGVVMNALYRDPPEGFRQAIAAGTDYLRRNDNPPSANVNTYLAAAYGQKYRYEQQRGTPSERLVEIERLAFEQARAAIDLAPSAKVLLRALWNPEEQVAAEDDLQAFHPSRKLATLPWTDLLS